MKTLLPSLVLSVMLAIPWRPLPAEEKANIGGFLLKNARVLDITRGRLGEPTRVRILGNRIDAIGNGLEVGAEQSVAIDLDGRVLIPGLIDLHTHLLLHPYNEATWDDQVLREQLELRVIRGTVHARKSLESGFTSIRDLGTEGAGFADVAIRDAILQGLIPGPRVFAVTKALVTSGGYGPAGFDPRFSLPKGAPNGRRCGWRASRHTRADCRWG